MMFSYNVGAVKAYFFNIVLTTVHVKMQIFIGNHFRAKSLFYCSSSMGSHRECQKQKVCNWICSTVKLKLETLNRIWLVFFSGFWVNSDIGNFQGQSFWRQEFVLLPCMHVESKVVSKMKYGQLDIKLKVKHI